MESFLERLSSYNILNNLLPGSIFCYLSDYLYGIDLIGENIAENLFVYYFFGMIMSRIGSIIIEPICKRFKIVKYADYKSFLLASESDDKLEILSETTNVYRTFLALFILLGIMEIYIFIATKLNLSSIMTTWMLLVGVILLFTASYRKQVSYIKKRVDCACQKRLINTDV